jgi:hypothetical protein
MAGRKVGERCRWKGSSGNRRDDAPSVGHFCGRLRRSDLLYHPARRAGDRWGQYMMPSNDQIGRRKKIESLTSATLEEWWEEPPPGDRDIAIDYWVFGGSLPGDQLEVLDIHVKMGETPFRRQRFQPPPSYTTQPEEAQKVIEWARNNDYPRHKALESRSPERICYLVLRHVLER